MASKNTVTMISALSDDRRIRIFETLAESDRSDSKLSEMLGMSIDEAVHLRGLGHAFINLLHDLR